MGGNDDACVLVIVSDDGVEDIVPRRGVDAAYRLIEQIESCTAAHDHDELHLLSRALGHLLYRPLLGYVQMLEHFPGALTVKVRVEVGIEIHELPGIHPLRQAGAVGQIAHERLALLAGLIPADVDLARVRRQQAVCQLNKRCFAAAVRAEQTHNAPRHDRNVDLVKRLNIAEALAQSSAFKACFHFCPPLRRLQAAL